MTNTTIPEYQSLSDAEKKKLQKQFHEGDLEYLASYAIESGSIASADLEDLYMRIDRRAAGGTPSWLNGFMLVLCGMLIGGSVFFTIFRAQQTHASHYEAISSPAAPQSPIITVAEEPATVAEKTGYPREHFSIHHPSEEIAMKKESYEELESKKLESVEINAPESEAPVSIDLESIPNAPVIYISDLKVANYKAYYFRNDQSFVPDSRSLSAEFADRNAADQPEKSVLKEKNYFAHEIIHDAMIAFHTKNYADCIGLLRLLYSYNKNDVNAQFYLGMCYYYLNASAGKTTATKYFDEVLSNNVNVFKQEAGFYKALALKESGNTEEAKALLREIAAKHSFYSTRAEELLKSL